MTPNLDKIASEGIRFTDFHVGASVCSVSRAALLTGRLGVRTGVVHNFAEDSMYGLPRTENTLAELLKPAKYRTAVVGKWHLGTTPGYHPTYRGFDEYVGLPYSVDMGCTDDHAAHDKPRVKLCGTTCKPTKQGWELPVPLYNATLNCSGQTSGSCNGAIMEQPVNFSTLSDHYQRFASEFILKAAHDPSPFFLYVPFSHVHTPQYAMPRNIGRSGKTGNAGAFYDSLMEADQTVGVIMQALKAAGVDDNTLVWVTGDNGPWEVKCDLTGSVGPFVGGWQKSHGGGGSSAKTTLWEAGHREPGLARWPARIKPRVSNATVSSLDFVPTMAALAGIELPSDREYDGMDISHVLLEGSEEAHALLFHPNSGASGPNGQLDGVRMGRWKAIYQTGGAPDCSGNHGTVARHDPPLLFDLESDPGETMALDTTKPVYAAVVKQIAAALAKQMHSVNTTMQSITQYDEQVSSEPCVHYPTSCRSNSPPAPPPPPRPSGKPTCNSSAFVIDAIPWAKAYPKPPFSKPVQASDANACCALCIEPDNFNKGCAFFTYDRDTKACYLKASVNRVPAHSATGFTSGSLYPL